MTLPYRSVDEYLHDARALARLLAERWDWDHFHINRPDFDGPAELANPLVVGDAPSLEVMRELRTGLWRPHPVRRVISDELQRHVASVVQRGAASEAAVPVARWIRLLRLDAGTQALLHVALAAAAYPDIAEITHDVARRFGQHELTVGVLVALTAAGDREPLDRIAALTDGSPLIRWGLLQRAARSAGADWQTPVTVADWVLRALRVPAEPQLCHAHLLATSAAAGHEALREWQPSAEDGTLMWLSGPEKARGHGLAGAWGEARGARVFRVALPQLAARRDRPTAELAAERSAVLRTVRADLLQIWSLPQTVVLTDHLERWAAEPEYVHDLFGALQAAYALDPRPVWAMHADPRSGPSAAYWPHGFRQLRVRRYSSSESAARWRLALDARKQRIVSSALPAFVGRYTLLDDELDQVVDSAAQMAAGEGAPLQVSHLQRAASRATSHTLARLAEPIDTPFGWDDLVLPDRVREQLRQLATLYELGETLRSDWGFGRQLLRHGGISALFHGPPGTGKTLSAAVVANHLGLDMFRVDLSRVVSKWVGETEKNLARLFDGAERARCVLLFDEADSLFARRTEVRSSQDRSANREVGYLLQRIESYHGIAILTSNLAASMDDAFQRRLSAVIQFPFPESDTRAELWRRILPAETPVHEDVDFDWLGENIELAGGHIKNALIRAALGAMGRSSPVTMADIVRACDHELRAMGRLPLSSIPSWVDVDLDD